MSDIAFQLETIFDILIEITSLHSVMWPPLESHYDTVQRLQMYTNLPKTWKYHFEVFT